MSQNLTTPFLIAQRPKRLDWVKLFKAEPVKVRGADPNKKNFQVDWIIEKDDPDLAEMVKACQELLAKVAAERKVSLDGLIPHKDFHWPLQAGEVVISKAQQSAAKSGRDWKPEYETHLAGRVILRTSAPEAFPPVLIVPVNGKFVQLDEPAARAAAEKHFFRGMLALGKIAFMGYDSSSTSWGVTAFANEVVATGKGERIGGAQADVAAYGTPEVSGTVQSYDPTKGAAW
jgi:hypothetical protein